MDRRWMYEKRDFAFRRRLEEFISQADEHHRQHGNDRLLCPCSVCQNRKKVKSVDKLREHLTIKGFKPDYGVWIWHGEKENNISSTSADVNVGIRVDDMNGMENDGGDHNDDGFTEPIDTDDAVHEPRKSRGATTGLKTKKCPETKTIQFDKLGRPMGDWDTKYSTDIGVLARNVNINIKRWKDVPEGEKETIWLDIKKNWNIQDEARRKDVISSVGKAWRNFKSILTTYYVYKTKPQRRKVQLDDPLSVYPTITKDDWTKFVKSRMDAKFKTMSELAKLAQMQNVHSHHMGREGYAKKIKKWIEEEIEQEMTNLDANSDDPNCTEESIVTRVRSRFNDRGYVWLKGHTPSSGNPPPHTKEVMDNIMQWRKKVEIGEFSPSGREDVLVKATGKLDHSGRTRAVGSSVGLQKHFGKSTRRGLGSKFYTDDDLKLLKEEIRRGTLAEMKPMMTQQLLDLAKANGWKVPLDFEANDKDLNPSPNRLHDQSSCYSAGHDEDPFAELKDPISCRLAQYDCENMIDAAVSQVLRSVEGKMVHDIPLSPQNAHVSIDSVIEPNAPLPVPFSGYTRVGELEGSFTPWPKLLVKMAGEAKTDEKHLNKKGKSKDTKESCNKAQQNEDDGIPKAKSDGKLKRKRKSKDTKDCNNRPIRKPITNALSGENHNKGAAIEDVNTSRSLSMKDTSELGPNCKALKFFLTSLSLQDHNVITIKVNEPVYNYNTTVDVNLSCDDIKQMFNYEWLDMSILQLWGSFLYDNEPSHDMGNIAYMCPQQLCSYIHDPLAMEMYVVNTMKKKKRYAMGAFFQDKHWMLVVICAEEKLAYIFDSDKAHTKTLKIISHIKGAWKVYGVVSGRYNMGKKNELTVKLIVCPQQPGATECAYYVMKWMYDITLHYSLMTVKDFEKCVSESGMTIEDMDQVRERWAKMFMDII